MSEVGAAAAQRHREHMRSKAERLGGGEDARNVDASSFTPGEPLDAEAKTGMRPVSRQARASGGAVTGAHARAIGGRAPRKAGGGVGESLVNRNAKEANEDRAGIKHDMGLRKGGRAHRANGGGVYLPDKEREGASETRALKKRSASSEVERRAAGGRVGRADGGPLSTPLAAGMGGQGRMNFNFAPNRATALADGGKAHERYGHGPSCACSSCRKGRAGGGFNPLALDEGVLGLVGSALRGGGDDDKPAYAPGAPGAGKKRGGRAARAYGGRSDESRAEEHAEDPAAYRAKYKGPFGERPSRTTKAERDAALAKAPKMFAEGGKVAEAALKSHRVEHEAMAKGRARGGRSGKGKMSVNIVIAPGGANPQAAGPPGMPPGLALKPPPAAPMPMPMPGGAPPPGGAPMPMPIPVPMGGAGMPPPGMPPRARGGRAPKIEAGAGSGLGRLEKIKAYGARSREGAGLRK